MTWSLLWQQTALRDLRRLSATDRQRVAAAVERLATTDQGDVRRLQNVQPAEWRLRVGEVRVRFRFEPNEQVLRVLRVLPRGRAYRE